MWEAYQDLKMCHKRPSEMLEVTDTIAAYCLDKAVLTFGIVIENALQERDKVGTGKDVEYRDRYSLSQLLDPTFTLPRPQPSPRKAPIVSNNGLAAILALAGQPNSGVKMYKYVPPEATLPN